LYHATPANAIIFSGKPMFMRYAGFWGKQESLGCGFGILINALIKTSVNAFSISRLPPYCLFTIIVALFLGLVVFDIKHPLSCLVWFY